jgi:predicted anti-sigma-YlaC factor YlaD
MQKWNDEHDEQMTVLMSLALDGLLEEPDHRRLEEHLDVCPSCRSEWEAMGEIATLFEGSPMVGPPLGCHLRVDRRLAERERKRRRMLSGAAVVTSSLSLAGLTVGMVVLLIAAVVAWQWLGDLSSVQQGTTAALQVASGLGVLGKGASLFLRDLLLRYAAPIVLALGLGAAVLAGLWAWLFARRPGRSQHNGFV